MKKLSVPGVILLLLLAGLGGCSKDSPTDTSVTDQQYFQEVASGNDAATQDLATTDMEALDETSALNALLVLHKGVSFAPVTPLRWGRKIESVTRTVTRSAINPGDTMATANVKITFTGKFIIQALAGTDTVVIQKPYTETLERNLRFEKIRNTQNPRLNWRLAAISVANGGTATTGISITSVQVITPKDTFTVVDPNNYYMEIDRWWRHPMPVLHNVPVTLRVTVQSASADQDLVTLHYLPGVFGLHHTPLTMTSETPVSGGYQRVFEKSWTLNGYARKFAHIMLSATTKASLYDDAVSNFSSAVWGIPYKPAE